MGEPGPPAIVRHLRECARGPLLCIVMVGLEVDGLVPLATTALGSAEKTLAIAAGLPELPEAEPLEKAITVPCDPDFGQQQSDELRDEILPSFVLLRTVGQDATAVPDV